ncbi:MAG TPA: restriction endonuclease subunit R [Anaerolineaceae bacterium]|nr:restriction endonuclease subunit R [Anaerolineaceae bacterium]
MPLNESDTRAQLIDPKLNRAGWTQSRVTREFYYRKDWEYAPGRIILRGGKVEREKPRRVDYLLRYTDAFPIAVVEAKAETEPAALGLEQAKQYARDNHLMFAYATNGHQIIEWDGFTNTTREITEFPSPDELWERWKLNTGLKLDQDTHRTGELRPVYDAALARARAHNPILHPYAPPEATRGSTPRYFQEVAIREVLVRIMRGQKRILLTMATGTGKTFTAMQIVWKLIKSEWLFQNRGRSGRVLFLADRVVLRNQAYNAFSPFAGSHGDPRYMIENPNRPSLQHDLYFGIYQTLWAQDEKGRRLFEKFPRDFFDIVIIDEAHRSGFGTWKEILDHFESAIHLGMTATPKQDENVDTYAYFCSEEPAIPLDPQQPEKGSIHPPAYTYSLAQGIEDGFLATYKVHRVRTNIDRDGLHITEVLEQGAEVIAPEDAEVREDYFTPQFEREIRLPDRTRTLVRHLAGLLREFGPTHKTMVFCVDMDHAQEVARLLNNEFADLGYDEDYAVPIVSEEGEQARRWLASFQDSDRKFPVVAVTAELLSTGVDVPACRNIVFMKTLSSPILFKQIIGRGSRIDPVSGKYWFRIIDYTNATRLLDKNWDCPPSAVAAPVPRQEQIASLTGTVRLAESGEVIVGASVAVMAAPNDQRGPILTDEQGAFRFDHLPAGEVTLIAYGLKLNRRQIKVQTVAHQTVTVEIELKPAREDEVKVITVRNLEVTIAEEATFVVAGLDEPLTLEQYIDYSRQRIIAITPDWQAMLDKWKDQTSRAEVQQQLERENVHPDVLAEVLNAEDADPLDVLAYVAFQRQPIPTRRQRVQQFLQTQTGWLAAFTPERRVVIETLLEKYGEGGLRQLTDPRVFRLPPFRSMGELNGVARRFGSADALRQTIYELQRRLYSE